jgi:hypothetical protein
MRCKLALKISLEIWKIEGNNKCNYLGLVYIMDHEDGPWKIAFSHGLTQWSNFHGPISQKKTIYKAFGPLTRCKPNVDQEE